MATRARAREIFDRSRVLLDRSRVVAAHLLDPPRHPTPKIIEAAPSAWAEAARNESLVDVCASIALRDLNLIDTLLAELEELERKEEDSTRLGQLYRLDHLAARLRRNAENLRVLADRDAGESGGDTISILDTVRGAMSSIDQYARIGIGRMVPLGVVGFAADDLSRVLTELLDNAASHSPPNEQVRVSAHLTEEGSVLIRIEDGGIGLPADRLAELNRRLSRALQLDDDAVRHMGLAVVGRLAERHDLRVSLHRRLPNGTTATVLVPPSLVTELPEEAWTGTHTVPVNGKQQRRPAPEPRDAVPVPATGGGPHAAAPTVQPITEPTAEPSELPRRSPQPSRPAPPPRPPAPAISGTTASGLPRRVPRSIKDTAEVAEPAGSDETPADPDGHDKFLADLGDFADGEQSALAADAATGAGPDEGDGADGDPK
ncbi:sensor histidine kinase [Pseudonocardia cypriaca]|uniref:histidine kinase n=1 Tax=Pseudonocardia cypriaca TaxID=882449 RepID=A0A543GJK1_9PSEU|nr:ATP-binding protein [Pseudonocardia cypriaca]TQM46215.1 histidine kinase/DNA gyrase B/HSP90-like ATPase [Pseudonocardia cypriaca]